MQFSATEAAFEGFRVTRRHPFAVVGWAAVMLAANILSALAVGLIAGPAWSEFQAQTANGAPDPALLARLGPKVVPAAFAYMLVEVAAAGIVNASVLRTLLRPERRARLGFGRDELRVVGVMFLFLAVSFAAAFVYSFVLTLIAVGSPRFAQVFALPLSGVVMAILTIRFSLAGPMTIAEHRLRFWLSWKETRRWFWPLLGAQALAVALAAVVFVLAFVIFSGVAGAIVLAMHGSIDDLKLLFNPDLSNPSRLLNLFSVVYLAFLALVSALVLVILVGPPVELYRLLQAERGQGGA